MDDAFNGLSCPDSLKLAHVSGDAKPVQGGGDEKGELMQVAGVKV